jgi:acetyl esterase/lipase
MIYCVTLQSPLVDLTHSTPSVSDDECIDFLPNLAKGINHAESQISKEFKEKAAALTAKIKKQNLGPKIWHDSFDKPDGRLEMYAPNEGLAIPYVSPMLAESLCNLPPLLLVRKRVLWFSLIFIYLKGFI